MAKNDVKLHKVQGLNVLPTTEWQTEAGATDILAGEPVKLKSAGSPYVVPLANGDPNFTSTTQFIGIAASNSSHTASADGTIEVYMPSDGAIWKCKATTSTNADTQEEIDALVGDRVAFDLSSSTYTVDENEGDNVDHGLQIVGGNPDTAEIYFKIRPSAIEGPTA